MDVFKSIMEAAPHDKDIADKLVPALVKYTKDALPNIKIVICRIFKRLVGNVTMSPATTNLIKGYFFHLIFWRTEFLF